MSKPCGCCEKWFPYLLSALRIVAALLILEHGTQKLFNYPSLPHNMQTPELLSMAGIAGILEFAGGLLLLAGLFTRIAAFILSGEMAVAYFLVHFRQAWWPIHNMGELAVIYCFVFLYLSAAGAGPWSVDHFWKCRAGGSENGANA